MFSLSGNLQRIYDLASEGRPLKIGMFTDTYTPQINGVVTSLKGLTKGLEQLGHSVKIVAPLMPDVKPAPEVIELASTIYPPQPEQRIALPPSPIKLAELSREDFDIIHCHGINTPMIGWVVARSFDLPMVLTYHTRMRDYIHYYPWYPTLAWFLDEARWGTGKVSLGSRLRRTLRRGLDSSTTNIAEQFDVWLANRCHQVIAPVEPIALELKEMGVRRPIDVVGSGIDIEKLQRPAEDPFLKLNLPENSFRLLTMSRLGKEKSVDVLLEYFAAILARLPRAQLIIGGDGPERKNLEDLVGKLGIGNNIRFVGYISPDDVSGYYQHADLFVFASTSETQGLVVPEAAACGLPTVARGEMGVTRCVIDGKTGYLPNPSSREEFVSRVVELFENPSLRAEMGRAAKSLAEDKWTYEKMALGHIEAYKKAILSLGRGDLEDDPEGEEFAKLESKLG